MVHAGEADIDGVQLRLIGLGGTGAAAAALVVDAAPLTAAGPPQFVTVGLALPTTAGWMPTPRMVDFAAGCRGGGGS